MFTLVCCGCGCAMAPDGGVTKRSCFEGGVINLACLQGEATRAFQTRGEIDAFAMKQGWTTRDLDGISNHRCPRCVQLKPETQRRGAYVNVLTGEVG